MRILPNDLEKKLLDPKQTISKGNAPELNLWIFRHVLPLQEERFLQTQVLDLDGATCIDVAVSHPVIGRQSEKIYIAYILDGLGKYTYANYKFKMRDHTWSDGDFEVEAEDISIAFDGSMPKDTRGEVEFVTEEYPWIFWVKDGKCYGQQINSNRPVDVLADQGCEKVDSIKAIVTDYNAFDFGLCVFMIVNGQLFYRQYIKGIWYDAELVSAFTEYTLVDVTVSRTWDYRVAVQVKDSNGDIYEIISQYQGIAKQNTEHLNISVNTEAILYNLKYIDVNQFSNSYEHLNLLASPIANLYDIGPIEILYAANTNGDRMYPDNYGRTIVLTVDKNLGASTMRGSELEWTLTDSEGTTFHPRSVSLNSDKRTVTLEFTGFNHAVGDCTIEYLGTTVEYEAPGVKINKLEPYTFTPQNLNPESYPVPEIQLVFVGNEEGTELWFYFTEPIDQDSVLIDDLREHLTFEFYVFNYIYGDTSYPKKSMTKVDIPFKHIEFPGTVEQGLPPQYFKLIYEPGNTTSLCNLAYGEVRYKDGLLKNSACADVPNFTKSIDSSKVKARGHFNKAEHIKASFDVKTNLFTPSQKPTYETEHITISVTPTAILTHINDL